MAPPQRIRAQSSTTSYSARCTRRSATTTSTRQCLAYQRHPVLLLALALRQHRSGLWWHSSSSSPPPNGHFATTREPAPLFSPPCIPHAYHRPPSTLTHGAPIPCTAHRTESRVDCFPPPAWVCVKPVISSPWPNEIQVYPIHDRRRRRGELWRRAVHSTTVCGLHPFSLAVVVYLSRWPCHCCKWNVYCPLVSSMRIIDNGHRTVMHQFSDNQLRVSHSENLTAVLQFCCRTIPLPLVKPASALTAQRQ